MVEMNNPGVWPSAQYADAESSRKFFTEVLGFTETVTYRSDDGKTIDHAELRWPEGGGFMYGSARSDGDGAIPRPRGPHWFYVVTSDPDTVYRRAVDARAKILMEPYDTDYGSRNVSIADPEGNVWTFGTYPGA